MTTGDRIAALRRERGWSQSQLAAALTAVSGRVVAREEVSRWEHGRRTPTPYWLSLIAGALGVPPAGLRPLGRREPPDGAGDVLAEALDWLTGEPPQVTARRAGRRIGRGLASDIAERVARLRHLDDTLPGHELAPVAAVEFGATAALVEDASYSQEVGASLLTSLGETGQILGWILADAGRHGAARYHYLEGFRAARQAGDTAGAANILSCVAYMRVNAGAARDGRVLAAAAVRQAEGRVPPLAMALLRERLGYASAHEGDVRGTGRALGPVGDLIEAGSAARDEQPEWTYWLNHDEAAVLAARCATRLGDAAAAVPLIEGTLSRYAPDHVRELALYWAFLAEARLRAGQRAEAAGALGEAERHAAGTASARVEERVGELRRALDAREPPGDGERGGVAGPRHRYGTGCGGHALAVMTGSAGRRAPQSVRRLGAVPANEADRGRAALTITSGSPGGATRQAGAAPARSRIAWTGAGQRRPHGTVGSGDDRHGLDDIPVRTDAFPRVQLSATPLQGEAMRITFVAKDPDSVPNQSPTLYKTDQGSWVVQGWRITDPAVLAEMNIPEGETAVEIPERLVPFFLEG